jgi:hypothetical protein
MIVASGIKISEFVALVDINQIIAKAKMYTSTNEFLTDSFFKFIALLNKKIVEEMESDSLIIAESCSTTTELEAKMKNRIENNTFKIMFLILNKIESHK